MIRNKPNRLETIVAKYGNMTAVERESEEGQKLKAEFKRLIQQGNKKNSGSTPISG